MAEALTAERQAALEDRLAAWDADIKSEWEFLVELRARHQRGEVSDQVLKYAEEEYGWSNRDRDMVSLALHPEWQDELFVG